jgi:4-hydroxybenzoate polyprenyltransferase
LQPMTNLFKIIRSNEWWEYKFPPILAVAYMISFYSGASAVTLYPLIIFLLLSLITGAVYVSILNDITDSKDDEKAGKINRMAGLSLTKKMTLLFIPVLAALIITFVLRNQIFTAGIYLLSYLCFTLYSVPPFRFKTKGYAGIVADAAGSQLFPSLFVASFLSFSLQSIVSVNQYILIGIWSLCFGLRGIIWHQFHDIDNDKKSGTPTVVRQWSDNKTKITGGVIIIIEFISLVLLLISFKIVIAFFSLAVYFLYVLMSRIKWQVQLIVLRPVAKDYTILLNEYYQVFLPVSILLSLSFQHPAFLFYLAIHITLFPKNTRRIIKNFSAPRHVDKQ